MRDRRDFIKIVSTTAVAAALAAPEASVQAQAAPQLGAVTDVQLEVHGLRINIGTDVLRVQTPAPGILRLDLLADGKSDPHTPVLDPRAQFPGDASAKFEIAGDPIRVHTDQFQVRISRNPCRVTILDKSGQVLLDQSVDQSLHVDPKNQGTTGFTFRHSRKDNFYGIRNSACWSKHFQPVLKDGIGMPNDTYKVEASLEGGGGAPFTWTTGGYGILVDSDGGYFQIKPGEIGFYYGNPKADNYGRNYFRPNSLTVFIFVGTARDIFRGLAMASGKMPLFPKWVYGFTNSQWGTNQELLRGYLETYRAKDIPIDNFTLDFDWKDWGASHYGEFRWNPVKYSQALYTPDNPDALINWTRELECKITGIMKPRIIISTLKGHLTPMTTQGASAKKLGIYSPTEKPFPDYFSSRMSIDLDFYKPICRQWYWHATWTHQCMQHGIVGFWNDEADSPATGNFEFLHMQQALYEGQRQDRPRYRVWSINRNFYLGSQRYAYATWSGDINTGFAVMRKQTLAMINTINLGQMRWAQDTGGFNGHPTPEVYTRWFQFTAVCPTLRTHCTLGERRQPWVYGDQACETVKLAIRQRYSWFFYTYALEHAACTETGVGIVRPLTFDYPRDPNVVSMADQWMFGDWILCAPVLEKMGSGKGASNTRRIYLPAGEWTDYFRGDRYKGGQWINYALNSSTWMDWPLFIKDGAIIPTAEPVRAIHTAKPEMIYLDIFPATTPSSGEFYDDDGESYDYEHGQFHRQIITAQKQPDGARLHISARQGAYASSVRHFVVRLHGQAAQHVQVGGREWPQVDDTLALAKAASGWCVDMDVYGPVTLVKVPAGTEQDLVITTSGQRVIHKSVEVLTAGVASLSGPKPPTVPLQTNNPMYMDAKLFGPIPNTAVGLATNHSGYTGIGFIAGFLTPGTAATFYCCRRKAGKYAVRFRMANGTPTTVQSLNVYVNGIRYGTLYIPGLQDWNTWEDLPMYLPLVAGNNTIMLRRDSENTGDVNLDCVKIPYAPGA
ncbi:MAG: TIM-barrel domain-containing protein [Phycisphaerae bacterium]